jgi:maltooligosyltrehalose trehalohydrolase
MTAQLAAGAHIEQGAVHFRVWAPAARTVDVVFPQSAVPSLRLNSDADGFFAGSSPALQAGARYRYRVDGSESFPDPYSRFQPEGPHGPSVVIDPNAYVWQDADWPGLDADRQVFYELHVGAFTEEGTYAAAARHLEALRALGVTCIELMPVAEFAGARGWGYDGVDLFAPYHPYGDPDALRTFVDRAHAIGLGVILDVVYNHVGADGNYLPKFSEEYFTRRHSNDWGQTLNYYCEPVRQLAIDNAAYWIREFHFDGLRLDAIQSVHDPNHPVLLAAIVTAAREAARGRKIVVAAEDYLQRAELLLPMQDGGAGLDYIWNDDFHHAARVALTGNRGGYFGRYRGTAQELLSTLRRGFLFQGQYDADKGSRRGSPTNGLNAARFVAFTQNHDQVGNTLYGARLHRMTSAGRARAMTAVLLLGPHTPLLFMGQEFDAATPFAYFADYEGAAAAALWEGRKKELRRFEQYAGNDAQSAILDPSALATFEVSRLRRDEREAENLTLKLYRDLLSLRREDAVLARRPYATVDGAVVDERAFVLRWFDEELGDRLLLVNLGNELSRQSIAEPLLAPPVDRRWQLLWSSDDPCYGGLGVVPPETGKGWFIASEASCFFKAVAC